MEDLDSVFVYHEGEHELRQKLMNARHELEKMKNVKAELLDLLNMAYQERDEARCQLQKLMNPFMPSNPTHLQNVFDSQSHLMFPSAKANSSITESDNSLSHGSSQVDSFFDTVSSPEFTNVNAVDPINIMSYLNQHVVLQDFNFSAPHALMVPSEKPMCDTADAVIDCLAKDRGFPQKGKFVQAVMDAGPLLKTLLLAGPLPKWRNPPPLQNIKVPPLTIKKCDVNSIVPNTFGDTGNTLLKPQLPALHYLNATFTCSASMLNFAGQTNGSSYNTSQLNSTPGVSIQVPSSKRLRHQ
ncbi:uncharacterized protein LOC114379077 isoform X1 [Glycine soja]|uniref:Uncharacterized protein n=2 Tax=Glycine soja TaxID=3848 RepID=A0A0B2RJT4_GLYSO|nr:uncharacterized protein LOC114379077 isoform X1 [Glycine soja]KHN32097.1 hypothetical protein glysoja_028892 [Glycine soja]RZB74637.1 hypothetical protein D0Y65_033564 [Glycine soja]